MSDLTSNKTESESKTSGTSGSDVERVAGAGAKSEEKHEKISGIKTPAASRIGRLCLTHQTPKAGLPPLVLEQKNGDDTMSRFSEEYIRSPLSDVIEDDEMDYLRGKCFRSSISPDSVFSRPPKGDRKISNGSMVGDLYWEATGRRRSSDHGVILTEDTDKFIIGQRVWVGGIRPGQIAYIGETHFAPGDWAGIVLDEPNGKNDGCVSGKRYFQCESKKGIFSRLTRLTLEPLPNAYIGKESSPYRTTRSVLSPDRSRTVSPTSSIRSSMIRSPGKQGMMIGDRVIVSSGFGSRKGILKYMGETKFAQGTWCGIQLDEPTGKNDGSVDGLRYFECDPNCGIFVPIAKVSLSPYSRKGRLSRTGSRESLTSVGTLNSIATTNTSRLRASSQKIPTATKIASAPKNTYSLQDVIREKQNHIEQLMIERDLDREDTQNQAMLFQKNITELKDRIAELEKLLEGEMKKTEDLQFSIDEAQFCGDELNAQTQVYKERILELEQSLTTTGLDPNTSSAGGQSLQKYKIEYEALQEEHNKAVLEIETLRTELNNRTKDIESKLLTSSEDKQSFQEEIQFLKLENEEMRTELVTKDENAEKMYLTVQQLQSALTNQTSALRKSIEEEVSKKATLSKTCREKDEIISQLQTEVSMLNNQINVTTKSTDENSAFYQQLDETNKQLQNKIDSLSKEIVEVKNAYDKMITVNQILQKDLELATSEKDNLKELGIVLNEKIERSDSSLLAKDEKLSEFAKQFEELEKNKTNLSKENESLKATLAEISNQRTMIESEIVVKEQEAETNRILIQEMSTKIKNLEEKLKENEQTSTEFQTDVAAQNAKLRKYQTDCETLQNQIESINLKCTEKDAALEKLTRELEDNSKSLIAAGNEIEQLIVNSQTREIALNAEIKELTDKLIEYENTNVILKSVEEKFELVQLEKDDLQKQLDETKQQLKTFTEDQERKTKTIEEQSEKLKEVTDLMQGKQTQYDQKVKDIENLNELCNGLKNAKIENEARIAELEIENGDKGRKIETITQKCNEVTRQYEVLQQELTNIQNSTSNTNSEVVRLTANLMEKQKAYEELLNSSNEARNEVERELQESVQNVATLQKEIEALKADIIAEGNKHAQVLSEANENGKKLELQIADLKTTLATEKENLICVTTTSANEMESLRSQLDLQLTSLQEALRSLEAELESTKSTSISREKTLLNQISEYGNEKEKLLIELNSVKTNENSLQELLEKQKQDESNSIQSINNQLQMKQKEVDDLLKTIESLKKTSTDLETKLSNTQELDENLQQKLNDTLLAFAAETEKSKQHEDYMEQLKFTILQKDSELEQLLKQRDELQSQVAAQANDIVNKLEALELSKSENVAFIENLKNQIEKVHLEESKIEEKLLNECEVNATLRQTVEALTAANENTKKELANKEETIKQQAKNLAEFTKQIENLQSDLNINRKNIDEVNSNHTAQIESLKLIISEKTEENSKLLKENLAFKTQIDSQREVLSQDLQKEVELQKSLSEKYQQLVEKHESCMTRIKELEGLLEEDSDTIGQLTTKIKNLEILIENIKTTARNDMQSNNENLQIQYNKLQQEKLSAEKTMQDEIIKLKQSTVSNANKFDFTESNDNASQINFLNSIIADMQKKNEALKARIENLESSPIDFTQPEALRLVGKRNPAPRLFCDICDKFDAHDTEDCPIQSSGSPSPRSSADRISDQNENGKKVKPPPRMFCDLCDIFDAHETEDCPKQCY